MTAAKPDSDSLPDVHVTIDGIEVKHARIELPDGTTTDWLLSTLPEGIKEGDVLVIKNDGDTIEIDHAESKQRHENAQTRLEALNRSAPTGEIIL